MVLPHPLIASFILIIMLIISPCAHGETIEITAGLYKGAEPLYAIEKRNGKSEITGMNVEIINAFIREAPEFQVRYGLEMQSISRIFRSLKDNRVQVVFGMAKSPEREKLYRYVDIPLYPVKFSIVARADDREVRHINSYKEMKRLGGIVLGVRATNAVELFKEKTRHLGIPVEVMPTVEQNLKKLLSRRGRYFVFNHYSLIDGAKKIGCLDKIVVLPLIVKKENHWLVFSRSVPEQVVEKANAVLLELQENGELKRIYEKYGKLR